MSTPRGGRGGDRSRGARGGQTAIRGAAGRGRGSGAPAQNSTERPTQAIFTPRGRGGNRGAAAAARGGDATRGTPNARGNTRGRGNNANVNISALEPTAGLDTTPIAQDDYPKRLERIRAQRPLLREQFIKEGRMNPEGQMRLSDSVKLIGICTDMCPEFERVRRIVEDDVKPPECTSETQHLPRKQRIPDEERMVKAYARSAAGMDVELVSEIRSPATCLKTLEYLMQRLDEDPFDFLHSWIWDRTRALRKDLRTQRIEQRSDITLLLTCLERSARFLLLSAHQMARTTKEDYSHQQDIEQLNATLMSLQERYIDNRRVGYPSAHEAEFWAYRLILAPLYTNTQLENQLHGLPSDLRNNPRVQTAIDIFRTLNSVILDKSRYFVQAQANWKRFWELIKSPNVSYLMACAAEVSFQRVRHVVLDTLWRVYRVGTSRSPQTVDSWTIDKLKDVLGMDTDLETTQLCQLYGFSFGETEDGKKFLDVTAMGFNRDPLQHPATASPQIFSRRIVEKKRYNRKFSAIVQAMSVQEAKTRGLLVGSQPGMQLDDEVEDSSSLFVKEDPIAQSNIFKQPNGPTSGSVTLSPAAPSFKPNTVAALDVAPESNPFIKAQLKPNPTFPGINPFGIQPGTFNPSKDAIKFATPGGTDTPTMNPFKPASFPTLAASLATAKPTNANPFQPASFSTSATSSATASSGTLKPLFNFFSNAANAASQQPAATTPTPAPSSSTVPELSTNGDRLSFTPAGTPAQAAIASQDEAQPNTGEEERRRKAEAEAEVQRQRAREEEARQARAAAERQRIEAEQQRQRLQQEEQNRIVREAQERQEREVEARVASIRARESAMAALTADIMFNAEEGLMLQFIENEVINAVQEVMVKEEEAKMQHLWEKKKQLANAMYGQQQLGIKRLVMAGWIAKVEKKKRARQARDRRRRLKEQRAQIENMEETVLDSQTPIVGTAADRPVDEPSFRKPEAPASARRARRTEERRKIQASQHNGGSDSIPHPNKPEQQTAVQAALTPVSMSNSLTSSGSYSEAYQKSTAPIDRTETDWFKLRAMGIDPSKHRKRSFGSASDEETQEVEPKRPKISLSVSDHCSQPQPTPTRLKTTEEQIGRFRAIQQALRKSGGLSQPINGATSLNGRPSRNGRSTALLEKARQLIARSPTSQPSPPNVQHDWGRSVPNLGLSTSSSQLSAFGKSTGAAPQTNRVAYWGRKSRFVPQHLYGQGPEAVRAYREQHALNSPASTRPASTEPLTVSSPIPTQQSHMPPNGYMQEQYSEEEKESGVEVIDADAEDEDAVTTEEEYEADEDEDEEDNPETHLSRRQSHDQYRYDEDVDSHMSNGEEIEYDQGYANGQYGQYEEESLEDYEAFTGEEEEEIQERHFAQPALCVQPAQPPQPRKQAPQPPHAKTPGATENDAIELSD